MKKSKWYFLGEVFTYFKIPVRKDVQCYELPIDVEPASVSICGLVMHSKENCMVLGDDVKDFYDYEIIDNKIYLSDLFFADLNDGEEAEIKISYKGDY